MKKFLSLLLAAAMLCTLLVGCGSKSDDSNGDYKPFVEVLESVMYVNPEGLVTHIDKKVRFTRGELTHEARRVEVFYETKKSHGWLPLE